MVAAKVGKIQFFRVSIKKYERQNYGCENIQSIPYQKKIKYGSIGRPYLPLR